MFFNPLFLQNVGNAEGNVLLKPQKTNGSGYLFSDIINVQAKSEEGTILAADLLPGTTGTAQTEGDVTVLENMLKNIAEGLVGIFQNQEGTETPKISKGLQNLQDGNLTDKELTKLISFLVGIKSSLISNENTEVNKDSSNKKLQSNNIDLSTMNDLLGSGKTLSIVFGSESQSLKIDIQRVESGVKGSSAFKVKLNVSENTNDLQAAQYSNAKSFFIVKVDMGTGSTNANKTLYSSVSKELPAMFKTDTAVKKTASVKPQQETGSISNKNINNQSVTATADLSKNIVTDQTPVLKHLKPEFSNNVLNPEKFVTHSTSAKDLQTVQNPSDAKHVAMDSKDVQLKEIVKEVSNPKTVVGQKDITKTKAESSNVKTGSVKPEVVSKQVVDQNNVVPKISTNVKENKVEISQADIRKNVIVNAGPEKDITKTEVESSNVKTGSVKPEVVSKQVVDQNNV
ncbi:MAG: hypothetical protein JEY94_18715, partial [Melioribacteraceae bacterium]|nr:hypothetical protein [Melioribacteraceae bacterium]